MKIKYIDSKTMILDDKSEWNFLSVNPPPASWAVDDDVEIETRGRGLKNNVAVNHSKDDTERTVSYSKGGISKRYETKASETYPDEWLDQDYKIRDIKEGGCIVIADHSEYGSIWKISNPSITNEGAWAQGQRVRISKGIAKIATYKIENFDINRPPFGASFGGFEVSKF